MKRRGRGMACMWYPIGFTVAANPSAATVKVNEDGTATVLNGTVETGQGSLTVLAQIAAEELGIAPDDVTMVTADTDSTPGYRAHRQPDDLHLGECRQAGCGAGQGDPF